MKKIILFIVLFASLSHAAVPCTNQDLKNELTKKLADLHVTPDLSLCELSQKAVAFNYFAMALITESCPSTPEVNSVLARYQHVKDHADELVREYCGF